MDWVDPQVGLDWFFVGSRFFSFQWVGCVDCAKVPYFYENYIKVTNSCLGTWHTDISA